MTGKASGLGGNQSIPPVKCALIAPSDCPYRMTLSRAYTSAEDADVTELLPLNVWWITHTSISPMLSKLMPTAPCGLRGCKNGPDPFAGRMSYKATKPGLAVCHILACFLLCCTVVVY